MGRVGDPQRLPRRFEREVIDPGIFVVVDKAAVYDKSLQLDKLVPVTKQKRRVTHIDLVVAATLPVVSPDNGAQRPNHLAEDGLSCYR